MHTCVCVCVCARTVETLYLPVLLKALLSSKFEHSPQPPACLGLYTKSCFILCCILCFFRFSLKDLVILEFGIVHPGRQMFPPQRDN